MAAKSNWRRLDHNSGTDSNRRCKADSRPRGAEGLAPHPLGPFAVLTPSSLVTSMCREQWSMTSSVWEMTKIC